MRRYVPVSMTVLAVALGGCAVGGAGIALMGVSLLGQVISGGNGAGPSALTIDPNKQMSDTLARSMRGVHPRCLEILDAMRAEADPDELTLAPGSCTLTQVCLAGMDQPLEMSVCAPRSETAVAEAPPVVTPARQPPIGHDDSAGPAAWRWDRDG